MAPKRILLPEDALKQLQEERMKSIDLYLNEVGKTTAMEAADLDMVLRALLDRDDFDIAAIFDPKQSAEVVEEVVGFAKQITQHKLKRLHENIKDVIKLKNITDISEHVLWNARRCGVDLLNHATPDADTNIVARAVAGEPVEPSPLDKLFDSAPHGAVERGSRGDHTHAPPPGVEVFTPDADGVVRLHGDMSEGAVKLVEFEKPPTEDITPAPDGDGFIIKP